MLVSRIDILRKTRKDIGALVQDAPLPKTPKTQGKSLTGGRLNDVRLLRDGNQSLVLKKASGDIRVREMVQEYAYMKYLSDYGLSPKPRGIDLDQDLCHGAMTMDYLTGASFRDWLQTIESHPDASELANQGWMALGRMVGRLHSLPLKGVTCSVDQWLENMLDLAKENWDEGLLDPEEFEIVSVAEAYEILSKGLGDNGVTCGSDSVSYLHGDLRTKNIMINEKVAHPRISPEGKVEGTYEENSYQLIDWGFADIGSAYYDLAILDYYFPSSREREGFYAGYGRLPHDAQVIEYYDLLSKFINV